MTFVSIQQNLEVVERSDEPTGLSPDWSGFPSGVTNYRVIWTLDHYENIYAQSGLACRSPPFNLNGFPAWIALYPVGRGKDVGNKPIVDNNECISEKDAPVGLYLEMLRDHSTFSGKLVFKISSYIILEMLLGRDTFSPGFGWGFPRVCCRQRFSTGSKVIECMVSLMDSANALPIEPNIPGNETLLKDLDSILETEAFSDITIQIGDHQLKAHKNILSARSPVFSAMLKADMMETRTNIISITDVDVDVMKQVLKYIYTGRIENFEDSAEDLIIVADKYDLQDLRTRCEKELCKQVDMMSVANLSLLAYMHQKPNLLKTTFDFIQSNWKEFQHTDGWQEMKKACSDYAFVVQSLAHCSE